MSIRKNTTLKLDDNEIHSWDDMMKSYQKRIKEYGYSHKSLYYPDEELHYFKLTQVSTIVNMTINEMDSLLDVGCGVGDIIPFLNQCKYLGIDIVEEFIDEAEKRYPQQKFLAKNLLNVTEKFDWILFGGMMGTIPKPEALITKGFELANKGIIIDFIDKNKYSGYLNNYDIGQCVNLFLTLGAQSIHVIPTNNQNWTFLIVHRETIWS